MSAASGLAAAAPPPTSPYVTDSQNLYVQDETAQGIGSLNMVLCVIGSMDPSDLVNAGPYLALVDMTAAKAPRVAAAPLRPGRKILPTPLSTSRALPTAIRWSPRCGCRCSDQGVSSNVYAYVSATQSPATAPPYGAFRMDYIN